MSHSFNTPAPGSSHSNVKPALEGNDIYNVTFIGCESKDIVGKQDPSKTYKTLLIKFSNEDGYFTHTVFEPKDEDFKRPISDFMGNPLKFPKPSNVENMMLLFKHLIDAVSPEIAAAIDAGNTSLSGNSWDEIRNLVVDLTKDSAGKVKTNIKLLSGKNGATFPFFTGLTKEGVAYVNNNFIGEKLFFNNYEKTKISGPSGSAPSNVPTMNLNLDEGNTQANSAPMGMDFSVLDIN